MNLANNDGLYYVKSKQVEQIYQDLSTELMFNMIARLAERGNADLERNPYIWQLEKLNDMHLLTEESVKMISEKAGIAEEIFRDVIENEGYKIYKDSHEQLTTALQSNTLPDPQVQASLNALVNQTMFEVDNLLNITLPKSIRRSFEQAVLGSVAGVVTGTKTAEKALSEAVQKAHKKGFYSFTDKAGRERSVEPHLRTIIKTTTRRTARELREKSAEDLGVDTFYYSIKSSARAYCAPLQHQIVSKGKGGIFDGVKVYALSDYGYGKPEGCQGINCDHYMTPFVLGMNYKPDLPDHLKNIDEKKAIENAKAEAKQRAFEREIRKSKELIEIAKIVNDKELEQKHKLRLKTLRSGLKQHIEKNPFLYRDTSRERGSRSRSILPIERSNNNLNKNTMIDRKIINSNEYRTKFEKLGETERVTRNLYKMSKAILKHRHGTQYEDLVMINSRTNKTLVRSDYDKALTVAPTRSQLKMIKENKGKNNIIGIHNHPNSSVPSLSDLNVAYKRGYKYGLVVAHDGTIYKYSVTKVVDERNYNIAIAKSMINSYNKIDNNKFYKELKKYGVEMEEL